MIGQALGWICNAVAAGIGGVQINHIETQVVAERTLIRKWRSKSSRFLIAWGNFVFRLRRPVVRVLPTAEWIAWERIVNQSMPCDARGDPSFVGKDLVSEKIPGEPLINVLQAVDADYRQKISWLKSAARALLELHSQTFLDTNNVEIQLSHADATISNVLIDRSSGRATWFDFDLQHDLETAVRERQADDLRAFLFSLAACVQWDSIGDLVTAVRDEYQKSEVWNTLAEQVSRTRFKYDLLHLAQLQRLQRSCSRPCSGKLLGRQILELRKQLMVCPIASGPQHHET